MEEGDFRKGDSPPPTSSRNSYGFAGVSPTPRRKNCSSPRRYRPRLPARRAPDVAASSTDKQTAGSARTSSWKVHHLTKVDLDDAGATVSIDGKKHRIDTTTRPGARIISGKFEGQPFQ